MKANRSLCGFLLIICVGCVSALRAQAVSTPRVVTAFAVLSTSLDSKTSSIGDEVLLTTISDITVDGTIVIPNGSKIVGHVGGAVRKGKDEPKSVLAIVIDKALIKGAEIPLQAIIVAIAAPKQLLADDPTYEMMHSNEPKMVGTGPAGTTTSGSLPASSKASSTAAVATAEIKGRGDEPFVLRDDSQGTYGYEDLLISWNLAMPPPLTVFATKAKNLKLHIGTQVLLRMTPPRLPS